MPFRADGSKQFVNQPFSPWSLLRSHWHRALTMARHEEWVQLMLETAIDLTMQGFQMPTVLRAFAEVNEFRVLGSRSYPICRALTKALVGESLEFNTMSFEELLVH